MKKALREIAEILSSKIDVSEKSIQIENTIRNLEPAILEDDE